MIHAFNGLAIKSQEVVKNVRHTLLEAPFFRYIFFCFGSIVTIKTAWIVSWFQK